MATITTEDAKRLIAQKLDKTYGITVKDKEWGEDETDGVFARLGQWRVISEDEDRGLYGDDVGELTAQVVGSPEFGNVRVAISFTSEEQDELTGPEVQPFLDVEPVE